MPQPQLNLTTIIAAFCLLGFWGNTEIRSARAETPPSLTSASPPKKLTPPPPPKISRYATWLIKKYDLNADGTWQPEEWSRVAGNPQRFDSDQNQLITLEELISGIWNFALNNQSGGATFQAPLPPSQPQPPASNPADPKQLPSRQQTRFYVDPKHLPEGLPEWFISRDTDGDAQLTTSEFSPAGSGIDLSEFRKLDLNEDGILTPNEALGRRSAKPTPKKPVAPAPTAP